MAHAVAWAGVMLIPVELPNPSQVTAPASRMLIVVVGVLDSASTPFRRSKARLSSTDMPTEPDDFEKTLPSTSARVTYDSRILTVPLLFPLH